MSAKDLISNEIPALFPTMRTSEALTLMDELKVNALPLIENGQFICLLTEKELLLVPDANEPLGTPIGFSLSVRLTTHIFDILDRMTQSDFDILPVVGEDNEYKGAITRKNVLRSMAQLFDTATPGAVIHLEMNHHDFVLSELARLAEQNNTRIINVFTYPDYVSGRLQVFMKVDQDDATYFLRSLERFSYNVVAHYQRDLITDEVMQRRLDELLYYIEM